MPKIVIEQFRRPSNVHRPGILHRAIFGFNPHFLDFTTNPSDKKYVNPAFPLTLSGAPTVVRSKTGLRPTNIIPNEMNALGNVFYASSTGRVFSDGGGTEFDLGFPAGSALNNLSSDLILYNGKIVFTNFNLGTLARHDIVDNQTWTAFGTLNQSTHQMRRFQNRLHVLNAASGAFTPANQVKVYKTELADWSDLTEEVGIDLGIFFDIRGIENYQDIYNVLFARVTVSPRLLESTTVFLWDGVVGNTWDRKMTLEGVYLASAVRDGVVYAFTMKNRKIICSYFTGDGFRRLGEIWDAAVWDAGTAIPKARVAVFHDWFVLAAQSHAEGVSGELGLLFWNPASGDNFFIPRDGIVAAAAGIDSSHRSTLFFSDNPSGSNGSLLQFEPDASSKSGTGYYSTNITPAPAEKGEEKGKISIRRIDVEYDDAPPGASDQIEVKLTTKDAEKSKAFSSFTATIKSNTALSTKAVVEAARAIIRPNDLRPATEFMLEMTVTNATGTWDPFIRRVVVDYEPVSVKS